MKAAIAMWIVGVILFVAFWGTVFYVAAHFINKFW